MEDTGSSVRRSPSNDGQERLAKDRSFSVFFSGDEVGDPTRTLALQRSEERRKKREELEVQMKAEEEQWELERKRRQEERRKRREAVETFSKALPLV